jgi:hypothetical protein
MVVILAGISRSRLGGGVLSWTAALFLVCGVFYVVHAGVEVAGLGEELYAITALVATLLLAFCMVIIDITTKMLGGSNERSCRGNVFLERLAQFADKFEMVCQNSLGKDIAKNIKVKVLAI